MIYEWASLPGCWRGKASGSQFSVIQRPIVPSSLTAGEAAPPPLPLIFYRTSLALHVTVKRRTNCTNIYVPQGVCVCVPLYSDTHIQDTLYNLPLFLQPLKLMYEMATFHQSHKNM